MAIPLFPFLFLSFLFSCLLCLLGFDLFDFDLFDQLPHSLTHSIHRFDRSFIPSFLPGLRYSYIYIYIYLSPRIRYPSVCLSVYLSVRLSVLPSFLPVLKTDTDAFSLSALLTYQILSTFNSIQDKLFYLPSYVGGSVGRMSTLGHGAGSHTYTHTYWVSEGRW